MSKDLRSKLLSYEQKKQIDLENRAESKSFFATALAWIGSVTPKVIGRVLVASFYGVLVCKVLQFFPEFNLSVTPFEYSGAVLALSDRSEQLNVQLNIT